MNACAISGPHYIVLLAAGASLALIGCWLWHRLKSELEPPPANVHPIRTIERVCTRRDDGGAA